MIRSIRGAVHFEQDCKEIIIERTNYLIEKMIVENELEKDKIVNIIFSVTNDLKSINPATALRMSQKYNDIPLFCAIEPEYIDSLKRTIRILLTVNANIENSKLKHIYIDGAEKLRLDLKK